MIGVLLRVMLIIPVFTCRPTWAAAPIFENQTPAGFSKEDSTKNEDFVVSNDVHVRVDLNQRATYSYPVVGHFHAIEKSVQRSSTNTDAMQVDVAMVDVAPFSVGANLPATGVTNTAGSVLPVIHMAWIEETNNTRSTRIYTGGTTPTYEVMYARSYDGGQSFDTAASVSNNLRYHLQSMDGAGNSFSTLDLEVDSGGNPRVVYAFVSTADRSRNRNVYFAHSDDGGNTWENVVRVNDVAVVGTEGTQSAFPRMVIDDRDNSYITYVRGVTTGAGTDDVMLAKVNKHSNLMVTIGSLGTAGSSGGVRLSPDGERQSGPELALGDGDALHLVYHSDADEQVQHKVMRTDTTWIDVSTSGWSQDADGSLVISFDDEKNDNTAIEENNAFFFSGLAVDRQRSPDRVYGICKWGSSNPACETIGYNVYDDLGTVGSSTQWGTPQPVWACGTTSLFDDGIKKYNVELDWTIAERVSVVVDDRLDDRGDVHIAFTAGYSGSLNTVPGEHDIYYARFNGSSWTLPEKVADDDSDGNGTSDGILNTDVYMLSPTLVTHPDFDNLYLAFAGGTDEGFDVNNVNDVNHHPYFKVIGRSITSEDESVPVGGFQYTLSYSPVNPQTVQSDVNDNPIYVHVADPTDGSGLGSSGWNSDGFLTGNWETVGATTLSDFSKFFEGMIDEDTSSQKEWGDDDDKVGLLVKLNVLGSDSATNLQVVTNSSAAATATAPGRGIAVGSAPIAGFAKGTFFAMGADIDILPSNNAPVVNFHEPDGKNDPVGDFSYTIRYDLTDADDALSSTLNAALYAYPSPGLTSVQDIQIFATLIVDQNDNSTRNASGTDDFTQGMGQDYEWDDPPAGLQSGALFASISKIQSGHYYIYLIADDGKNQPVFDVSDAPLTIRHGPVIQQIDPIAADTVDTGVRTGLKANPYDLDFRVVDMDSDAQVQLFYAAVSGLMSVSATGTYPTESFVLGKSVSGTRATAITSSTSLTNNDLEISWDVTNPLVPQGAYYLYAVATDSISVTVGNSTRPLTILHSPSFSFYEPAVNTRRTINSGSQPVYTIQWQKGPGDEDLDDDASLAFYFTEVDPATKNFSGNNDVDLLKASGGNAQLIEKTGLSENGDGPNDMFVWNLRDPPNAVPESGTRVWLYAVTADGSGNKRVELGGSLAINHDPFIFLESRLPQINQGDIIRLEWDDYMVDDGIGTEDAYIRLYASPADTHLTIQSLEVDVLGSGGSDDNFIINSSDGTVSGTITTIRGNSSNAFNWDTSTSTFTLLEGSYFVYAGISSDGTFSDNSRDRVSIAPNALSVSSGTGIFPNMTLSPNKLLGSAGDTLDFDILVQSNAATAELVSAIVEIDTTLFSVVNPTSPFTDFGIVFSGGTVVEDTTIGTKLRYTKRDLGGEKIGSSNDLVRLGRFSIIAKAGLSGLQTIAFDDESSLTLQGTSVPLNRNSGISLQNASVEGVPRGRIIGVAQLEARSAPIGNGDHATLLDVHLRLPGSVQDVIDSSYIAANDDYLSTADTVEVMTKSNGDFTLISVPVGRYVLSVKDTSHLAGRTDTISVRNGETVVINSTNGFFSSDVRGDPSLLLGNNGQQLRSGDVTEDNEIDEDDVNVVDSAWGTDPSMPQFAQADMNNDGRVGVEDLTLTTSNISNLTGLGTPPVFKLGKDSDANPELNNRTGIEFLTPDFVGEWRAGMEIELTMMARGLRDIAGYSFALNYDPMEMALVEKVPVQVAGLFSPNPQGHFNRVTTDRGTLEVAAARHGRDWSADGDGVLAILRIVLFQDGFPESLQIKDGIFLSSEYETIPFELLKDPAILALPSEFSLDQNFPNPFNPVTTISFRVPVGLDGVNGLTSVSIEIFNILGQSIFKHANDLRPGYHRAVWDGRNHAGRAVGSGLYLYQVQVGEEARVGKMTLLK